MSLKRNLRSGTRTSLPPTADLPIIDCDPSAPSKPHSITGKKSLEHINDNVNDPTSVEPPSTPPRKRTKITPLARLPSTPSTVSAHGTLDGSASSTSKGLIKPRPAEPRGTNATLKTPGGSRLVPFSREIVDSSPVKGGLTKPTTTTQDLLEQACAHLIAVDSRMKPLIERHHCRTFSPEGLAEEIDPFESLCSGIISQQVSGVYISGAFPFPSSCYSKCLKGDARPWHD